MFQKKKGNQTRSRKVKAEGERRKEEAGVAIGEAKKKAKTHSPKIGRLRLETESSKR